ADPGDGEEQGAGRSEPPGDEARAASSPARAPLHGGGVPLGEPLRLLQPPGLQGAHELLRAVGLRAAPPNLVLAQKGFARSCWNEENGRGPREGQEQLISYELDLP